MTKKTFKVTPEFKEEASAILHSKKFSAVYPYMNLINRDTSIYSEDEINAIIQLLSEFSYSEVAEFFNSIKLNVQELGEDEQVSSED